MEARPAISVVIPNYDGLAHLDVCLSALRAQTFRNFEVILVDNGSTDDSIHFVRENFPEVAVTSLEQNRGFAAAINAGTAVARGTHVAFLNNDTQPDPGWLDALHRAVETGKGYDMWASRVVLFESPEVLDSAGDQFTRAGVPRKRGRLEPVSNYRNSDEVFAPSGSAALYRKNVLDELGGLDEDFFLIHEDVDLALRARLRGYRCWYVADAVVRHKVNSSIGHMSRDYVFYGHRNLEYVLVKDLPLSVLLRCLPAHFIFSFFAFGYFLTRGRGLTFIHAKFAFLAKLMVLLRKRSVVQAQRRIAPGDLFRQMTPGWFFDKLRNATAISRERDLLDLTAEVRRPS